MGRNQQRIVMGVLGGTALVLTLAVTPVISSAADAKDLDAATRQVGDGARQVRQGEVLDGLGGMAKGVGKTVVEGAKFTGETIAESTTAVAVEVGRFPARLWQRLRTY